MSQERHEASKHFRIQPATIKIDALQVCIVTNHTADALNDQVRHLSGLQFFKICELAVLLSKPFRYNVVKVLVKAFEIDMYVLKLLLTQ